MFLMINDMAGAGIFTMLIYNEFTYRISCDMPFAGIFYAGDRTVDRRL